jgi:CRP-like cAMP-binding protein
MKVKKLATNGFSNASTAAAAATAAAGSPTRKAIVLKLKPHGLLDSSRRMTDETLKKQPRDYRAPLALRAENLFSNHLLKHLSGNNLARLSPYLESVSLVGGEELNRPGEPIDYVYFPEEATVSQFQVLSDGSTAEIVMVGREGAVGLDAIFGERAPSFWTQTITPGAAVRVRAEILKEEFQRSARLQALLLGYVNSYVALISQRVSCNIRHVAEARFCTWLLMLRDRTPGEELCLTQEQIAACLGINRPTVTTFAKTMKEDGLIEYARGRIRIRNRRRLEAAACECYATVKSYLPDAPLDFEPMNAAERR